MSDETTLAADLPVATVRERQMQQFVEQLRSDERQIAEGGGRLAVERQHEKGRLTARERITQLIDPEAEFLELTIYAAFQMYTEWGGAPAAGVVTGVGKVCGRDFLIIANDATVKAGSFFPMTAKKVLRAQQIALENHIPTIYLVDSAGIFLPLQEDVFPDTDDFGRVFYNNAVMSARGIPQIAAIMGSCAAGGAYLPVMCDKLLMTEGSGLFLAGHALVKAAVGQKVSAEELGGAEMHASISGTIDFKEKDDPSCLQRIRELIDKMGERPRAPFDRREAVEPLRDSADINRLFGAGPQEEYDMRQIIACIVDGSEFTEYKAEYGQTLLTGYARVGGFAVGIVANQKTHVRKKGKRFEFGGVIYTESANKAVRFILDCNQNLIPLLFLHDVNGFMVGRSFGAGHYAMCGKAYSPRFIYAWPTARYAVMGGDQAAGTLVNIKIKQLERLGKVLSEDEKKALSTSVKETCEQ